VAIDDDLGRSGATIERDSVFQRLVAEVGLGNVLRLACVVPTRTFKLVGCSFQALLPMEIKCRALRLQIGGDFRRIATRYDKLARSLELRVDHSTIHAL